MQRDLERLAELAKGTLTLARIAPVGQAGKTGTLERGQARVELGSGDAATLAVQLERRPRLRFAYAGTIEQA